MTLVIGGYKIKIW